MSMIFVKPVWLTTARFPPPEGTRQTLAAPPGMPPRQLSDVQVSVGPMGDRGGNRLEGWERRCTTREHGQVLYRTIRGDRIERIAAGVREHLARRSARRP